MDSIDQHASMPIKKLTLNGTAVMIDMGVATFDGTLDTAKGEIAGTFHQGPGSLPLTFRKVDKLPSTARPQDPVPPFPYAADEVVYAGLKGFKLAGTLTYPKTGAPFAAALLITGSGAQDRDESLMGHKPFLVLSDYLTRLGFAVLRVDDRGTGKSEGVFAETSYEDKVGDVLAGIAFLKTRKEIAAGRIGLIGHSEGATIGPMAAARSTEVAFVVMMAGMGVQGRDLLRQQGIDSVRSLGGSEADVQTQVEIQTKLFQLARTEKDPAAFEKRVRELIPGPAAEGQIQAMRSLTIRDLLATDPNSILQALSCPVLAINGSKDTQVNARQNLPAIAVALAASKSVNWTIAELPGLNHLFQTANTGSLAEYSTIEETIAPAALQTVGEWLKRNCATPGRP